MTSAAVAAVMQAGGSGPGSDGFVAPPRANRGRASAPPSRKMTNHEWTAYVLVVCCVALRSVVQRGLSEPMFGCAVTHMWRHAYCLRFTGAKSGA